MAVDEGLEERVRLLLEPLGPVGEKRMFGGLAFLIGGNMAALIIGSELVARIGPDAYEAALNEPGTRPFDFTGRPMRGWVVVTPEALSEDPELEAWLRRGVAYAASLPEK